MDKTEFENLLGRIGWLIENSTPVNAEYWRGYIQGLRFSYRRGSLNIRDRHRLRKIADMDQNDPYLKPYTIGLLDGYDGKNLINTPLALDIPPLELDVPIEGEITAAVR